MAEHAFNVLFLCTGNSARSIIAEALLNHLGRGHFRGYSAGSRPKSNVHPLAVKVLQAANIPAQGLTSKSWEVFSAPGAPKMDFVITVCDNAAGETCPAWPGHPTTAHWGIEDPAAVEGTGIEQERAFVTALRFLRNRVSAFVNLPLRSLDAMRLEAEMRRIGQLEGASKLARS
jgi:arsenate reductase